MTLKLLAKRLAAIEKLPTRERISELRDCVALLNYELVYMIEDAYDKLPANKKSKRKNRNSNTVDALE